MCDKMARAYRDESMETFHDKMDQIKHEVKVKLTCKHGLQCASASVCRAVRFLLRATRAVLAGVTSGRPRGTRR